MSEPRERRGELSTLGTARLRFARHSGLAIPTPPMADFFRRLGSGARAHDLGDDSLYLAEELVAMVPYLGEREQQAFALLVLATLVAARQGSTRLPLSDAVGAPLGRLVGELIAAGGLELKIKPLLRDIVRLAETPTFDGLIGADAQLRPFMIADGCVYPQRLLWCERRLVGHLRARLDPPAEASGAAAPADARAAAVADVTGDAARRAAAVADVIARPASRAGAPVQLSDEQVAAVHQAVARPLTVISGGPGTGKTAIVVSILRALMRLPGADGAPRIALAAPTGKAANRMAESVREALASLLAPSPEDLALRDAPPEPQTLHRLLGYLPARDTFRHHENHPIDADAVILDESSMVDISLMERLLRSLRPSARLVLLGDADQLPSVEAGAVLRDLVTAATSPPRRDAGEPPTRPPRDAGEPPSRPPRDAGEPPPPTRPPPPQGEGRGGGASSAPSFAVRLTRSYRMDPSDPDGRAVLSAARAINEGKPAQLFSTDASSPARLAPRDRPDTMTFRGAELLDTGDDLTRLHAFVDHWYERFVRGDADTAARILQTYAFDDGRFAADDAADLRALFRHRDRSRLLCVTRRQPTGAEALNERLHERMLADSTLEHRPHFCPGEPVLVRQNDYARGLYNGDQGLVVRVSEDGGPVHFRVVFPRSPRPGNPGEWAVFHLDALRAHLEHAFAMTIHKSQGSEFEHVAVILPGRDLPLLTREMLYTAVTRARRSAALVGPRALIHVAARRPVERYSGLAAQLRRDTLAE